jgi:CHASE2 domain-containing sensor protein
MIGTTAESFRDYWSTPTPRKKCLPTDVRIVVQAHMVSQILSLSWSADHYYRPCEWSEAIWVWCWLLAELSLLGTFAHHYT